jgi:hypothetical protein
MSTLDSDIPVSYVQTEKIRGGNFGSTGLRALYFATTLLLWSWISRQVPFIRKCNFVKALVVGNRLDRCIVPFREGLGKEKSV